MRRPNSSNLAMRDPALAAALGAVPGPDYGHERAAAFGGFGYAGVSPYDVSRNIGFGYEGFGADAPHPPMPPAPPPHPMAHPGHGHHGHHGHHPHPAWLAAWHHGFHGGMPPFYSGRYGFYGDGAPVGPGAAQGPEMWAAMEAETARRARLLDPNEHSRLKIERYSFSLSPAEPFSLGTLSTFTATLQPNTRIRAQRVVMNAPVMNFVLVDDLEIANVNVLVGTTEDAYTYNANGQGVMLDLPTLDPANRATVSGTYTGLVPPGYASEFEYTFIVTFQGPSTLVGGL
jgi:hypothetical protein